MLAKKFISLMVGAAMVLSFSFVSYADDLQGAESAFVDMPNNWATVALKDAVENGLLKGYETENGLEIRPQGNITRAEMVTVVNRAFGAREKAALTGVTDVKNGAWYADEIAKAIGMQTMAKSENVRPNDNVTRQEAFTILARAYRQEGGKVSDISAFSDGDKVASWAVAGLGALVKKGYVTGSENKLNPTGYMTRAEFAKIMQNLTAAYVNTTETFSKDVTGNVIVNTPGAKLKDMKISGNLIIADGVGEGDVDLDNVEITGDIIVKAGGENSIHIANVTIGGTLVVNKVGGTVRIVASGTTNVKMVEVGSDVIITATDLKGGEIGTVKIDSESVKDVVLRGDFKTVETAVKDVKITASEGKIENFTMTEKANVTGTSEIKSIKNETGEKVSVNGKDIEAGATGNVSGTAGESGGTGGSSGGGSGGTGGSSGGGSGTGGGGSENPAPDNFVLGGANTFADGYPKFNLEEYKLTVKMATDTPSEIFGILNECNSFWGADSISVIHGHPSEFMCVDDVIYLNVSDTEEHEIDLMGSDQTDGGYVALVVKTGDKISAEPVKLTYSSQASQEADTLNPIAWSAFINSAENKVYVTINEQVTVDQEQVVTDFHLSNGTITSASVVSDEADNGLKKYYVVLDITGYNSEQECKLWYEGTSVKDTAENTLTARAEAKALTVEPSTVTVDEATSSQDMKHIEIVTSKMFLFSELHSNTHNKNDWYTVKYGTDWESAKEVTVSHTDWIHPNDGRDGEFCFEISNPPAAISGGKYFVELKCNGWKNSCFDACDGNLKTEVTRLEKAESPTPTVKYNASSKEITVDFGSHEIKGDHMGAYSGPACRFFITAQNGAKYKLRDNTGSNWMDENCIKYGEKAFPFNLATFNWEGATLSYSRAIHANECAYFDELHTADGNIYEGFSNVSITVE